MADESLTVTLVLVFLALFAILTTHLQLKLVFSLLINLSNQSQTYMMFVRKAQKILWTPLEIGLILLYVYVIVLQIPNHQIWLVIYSVIALFFTIFIVYKVLQYCSFVCIYLLNRYVGDEMTTEYFKESLPLMINGAFLVIALTLIFAVTSYSDSIVIGWRFLGSTILGLLIALGLIPFIRNGFGSITLLADRMFRIGDLVEINKVAGIVLSVGAVGVQLYKPGGSVVTVPSNDFLISPFVNHSTRNVDHHVFVRIALGESDFVRSLERKLSAFVQNYSPMKTYSISILPSDTTTIRSQPSSLAGKPVDPLHYTLAVSWQQNMEGVDQQTHGAISKARSEFLLALTEYLQKDLNVVLL